MLRCPMRSRRLIWLLLSVMLFVTGACIWRLGIKRADERSAVSGAHTHHARIAHSRC